MDTVIMLGDKVRLVGDIHHWIFEGWELYIPPDTVGTVVRWVGTKGCALRFRYLKHPKYQDWPMSLTIPGKSPMPWDFVLLEREEYA